MRRLPGIVGHQAGLRPRGGEQCHDGKSTGDTMRGATRHRIMSVAAMVSRAKLRSPAQDLVIRVDDNRISAAAGWQRHPRLAGGHDYRGASTAPRTERRQFHAEPIRHAALPDDDLGDRVHTFGQQLETRATTLKQLLVDPSFLIGLGDVYSDEVLWAAGLSGERDSGSLSSQEVRRLYRAVLEVLYEAVKQRGSVDATAVDPADPFADAGEVGTYIKVYGREGEPCARCRQSRTCACVAGSFHSIRDLRRRPPARNGSVLDEGCFLAMEYLRLQMRCLRHGSITRKFPR